MNAPSDRDARLDRLGRELVEVGRRVEGIRRDLDALRDLPPSPPAAPPQQSGPPSSPSLSMAAWPPPPARATRPPSGGRRLPAGLAARLLAITGGAVTVLGVVLLLVLAARSGWFSPGARVIGGAVLGLVLVAAGTRARRRPGGETGAVALVATGTAALYLDVAAASTLYAFLPVPAALLAALVVMGGGLVLADRWCHRGLGLGALAGGAVLAPVVAGEASPVLVALLVAAQVTAAPVAVRRGWPSVTGLAAAIAVLGGAAAVLRAADLAGTGAGLLAGTVAAGVAVAAVGTATAVAAGDRFSGAARGGLLIGTLPPVLLAALLLERWSATALVGVAALVLLALGVVCRRARSWLPPGLRRTDPVLARVALAGAAVAGLEATTLALRGAPQAAVLLGQSVLLAVLAVRTTRRGPLVAAAVYGTAGLVLALGRDVPLHGLGTFPAEAFTPSAAGGVVRDVPALVGAATVAVLVAAAATALLGALSRLGLLRARRITGVAAGGLGLVGLYGVTGTVVPLALLASPTRVGFLTGHVLVTVSWAALALVLLVRGLRDSTPRLLGGVLVVAAVGKLAFFDLTALDGVARVAAFLGAGIVLLVAGARYARAVGGSGYGGDPEASGTAATSSAGPARAPARGGDPEA